MSKIKIKIERYSGDCDDCGYYEGAALEIFRGETLILSRGWNNHLGGDICDPTYNLGEFLKEIFEGIGLEVSEVVEEFQQ